MALIIPNYQEPGAYSTIVLNPTTVSSSGPPIVAVVGQALQGTYSPSLFYNADDAQKIYGNATKANPLPLGIQLAFANGASRVLGVNVEPTNSQVAYMTLAATGLPGVVICNQGSLTSNIPTETFSPAPSGANGLLDPVTQLPINLNGTVAGVFYIQDFNPDVADPVLNSSPQATQTAFALAAGTNLLQYIIYGTAPLLNGVQQVPLANTNMVKITVPAISQTAVPTGYQSSILNTAITQGQWNQLNNAIGLTNAINSTPNVPIIAQILIPNAAQTDAEPFVGWQELYSCLEQNVTINTTTYAATSTMDLYALAVQYGVLSFQSIQPGSQHEIVLGMFATSDYDTATNTLPFGLPCAFAGTGYSNPFLIIDNGVDGVVTDTSYINTINNVLTTVRADIVVCLNTNTGIQSVLKDHVTFMSTTEERNERIAIVSGPVSELYTTSIANAQALQGGAGAERMVYIWPTGIYYQDPVLRSQVILDGTYTACACAGILAGNDAATPLTRQVLSGFIDVTQHVTRTLANSIAQNGITVIENNPTQGLRVRHGLTCDPTYPETQEISVVRQVDFVAQTVRDALDLGFIGTKIVPNTVSAVTSVTTSTLTTLVNNQIIYGFKNVSAMIDPSLPTQIDVRFDIRPAYPLNYIQITLSVDSTLSGF